MKVRNPEEDKSFFSVNFKQGMIAVGESPDLMTRFSGGYLSCFFIRRT